MEGQDKELPIFRISLGASLVFLIHVCVPMRVRVRMRARACTHTHTHIHTQVCNEKQHIFKLQNQSTVFSPQPLREEGKEIGHSQPPRRHPKALDPYCHVL